MKTVTIKQFQTTDGKNFDDEAEALQWQAIVDAKPKVEMYLDTLVDSDDKPISDRARSMHRNTIFAWEKYKVTTANVEPVASAEA